MSIRKLLVILLAIGLVSLVSSSYALNIDKAPYPQEKTKINRKELLRFGIAFGQIKKLYLKDVKDKKLFSDAIGGLLSGLDPHSDYLDKEEMAFLKEKTKGEFSGLGMEVTMERGMVKVISPIDDSPAAKAGIKPGDIILGIDGKPLTSGSLLRTVKKLRGKKGTYVTLTVINKGDKKPRDIKIKRGIVPVISVKSRMLTKNFGYIRISHFQKNTAKRLREAVKKLQKKVSGNLKGLILDLRNNPGGILKPATDTADAFIDSAKLKKNKLIVYTKGRARGSNLEIAATPGDILNGAPLIVLINPGSASGSEIIAGALQDYNRALIVGKRSFGKGSVQTVLPLDRDTGIKLTVALYYTPKGRSIQARGIKPDIEIDNLKLAKEEESLPFFWKLHEEHFENHIKNGKKNQTKMFSNSKALKKLAKKDYQLYEALQILKSSYLIRKHG